MSIKKHKISTLLLAGILTAFIGFGCDDNGSGSDGNSENIPESGVVASIDGESWESGGANAFESESETDDGDVQELSAIGAENPNTGVAENNELLDVTVFSEPGASSVSTGTYEVKAEGYPRAQIGYQIQREDGDTSYVAESGEVTIAEVTEDGFSGTFNGTLTNPSSDIESLEVTEGGFNVEFVQF